MKTKVNDLIGKKYFPIIKNYFPIIFPKYCEKCDCEIIREPMWKIYLGYYNEKFPDPTFSIKKIYICKDCINNYEKILQYAKKERIEWKKR